MKETLKSEFGYVIFFFSHLIGHTTRPVLLPLELGVLYFDRLNALTYSSSGSTSKQKLLLSRDQSQVRRTIMDTIDSIKLVVKHTHLAE